MKKVMVTSITVVLMFCVFCAGWAGLQDWTDLLPNDYYIVHTSPIDIWLSTEKYDIEIKGEVAIATSKLSIPEQIIYFWHDERYVSVIRIDVEDYQSFLDDLPVQQYWYIVDTLEDELYGPYQCEEDYQDALEEIGLFTTNSTEWIPTIPRPDGALH